MEAVSWVGKGCTLERFTSSRYIAGEPPFLSCHKAEDIDLWEMDDHLTENRI